MNIVLKDRYHAGAELDMDALISANILPFNDAISAMKRLTILDTERRKKLAYLGIVSTSDMYVTEDGRRIKNEKDLNALIVEMFHTDTPVDINTIVEDYDEPMFTPMLKCVTGGFDVSTQETKCDDIALPAQKSISEFTEQSCLSNVSDDPYLGYDDASSDEPPPLERRSWDTLQWRPP